MTHPTLDPTTPWYNHLSYCETTRSLGIEYSLNKFIRYINYYKSVLEEKSNDKNSQKS